MIFYVIRHKATGQIMPQAKRDRGYSNWNPTFPDKEFKASIGVPRLLESEDRAKNVIKGWIATPNGIMTTSTSWEGETDVDISFKDDGRKKEDLEIVPIELVIGDDR